MGPRTKGWEQGPLAGTRDQVGTIGPMGKQILMGPPPFTWMCWFGLSDLSHESKGTAGMVLAVRWCSSSLVIHGRVQAKACSSMQCPVLSHGLRYEQSQFAQGGKKCPGVTGPPLGP